MSHSEKKTEASFSDLGGHGALIENLNEIDADIIFIKNIDNIIPDRLKDDTFKYKKLIGSYLIDIQEKYIRFPIRSWRRVIRKRKELTEMLEFLSKDLSIEVPEYIGALEKMEQMDWLFEQFNRPIRVCGIC